MSLPAAVFFPITAKAIAEFYRDKRENPHPYSWGDPGVPARRLMFAAHQRAIALIERGRVEP